MIRVTVGLLGAIAYITAMVVYPIANGGTIFGFSI